MNKTYRPADGDESGWGSDEWDSSDEDNQSVPPTLPPKDACSSGIFQMYENTEKQGRKLPRILPVVRDGEKSQYYYFVVPERDKDPDRPTVCSPITAEVKPFSVGGVQVESVSRRRAEEERYQNINFEKTISDQRVGQFHGANAHQVNTSVLPTCNDNFGVGETDLNLISWTGLTGMTPVGTASSSECSYGNINSNPVNMPPNTPAQSSQQNASVSMSSVRMKITEVQRQVHGVTQDECDAALSSNRWDVEPAVKYLKVEQLFRLGIAPKEKCQNLLESLKWNLQTAGSVLLDEVSTGSAV